MPTAQHASEQLAHPTARRDCRASSGGEQDHSAVEDASRRLEPSLAVLNAVSHERVRTALPEIRALAKRHRLALGGVASTDSTLERSGILTLTGGPTAEAARVSTLIPLGNEIPKNEA